MTTGVAPAPEPPALPVSGFAGRQRDGSIGAAGKAFEVISTALKGAGDRQSTALQVLQGQLDAMKVQEIAEMRKELKSIFVLIQQQGAALEALAKKKGFSF